MNTNPKATAPTAAPKSPAQYRASRDDLGHRVRLFVGTPDGAGWCISLTQNGDDQPLGTLMRARRDVTKGGVSVTPLSAPITLSTRAAASLRALAALVEATIAELGAGAA